LEVKQEFKFGCITMEAMERQIEERGGEVYPDRQRCPEESHQEFWVAIHGIILSL
jgi:hypothetical protein